MAVQWITFWFFTARSGITSRDKCILNPTSYTLVNNSRWCSQYLSTSRHLISPSEFAGTISRRVLIECVTRQYFNLKLRKNFQSFTYTFRTLKFLFNRHARLRTLTSDNPSDATRMLQGDKWHSRWARHFTLSLFIHFTEGNTSYHRIMPVIKWSHFVVWCGHRLGGQHALPWSVVIRLKRVPFILQILISLRNPASPPCWTYSLFHPKSLRKSRKRFACWLCDLRKHA